MTTPRSLGLWARALSCALLVGLAPAAPVGARSATPSPTPVPAPARPRPGCKPPNRAFSLRLPGQPLSLAQTPDGCYLFVGFAASLTDTHHGLALLHREARSYAFVRSFDTGGTTDTLSVSRDGTLLAARVLDHGVVLLDVARAIGGDPSSVVADLADVSLKKPGAVAFDGDGSHVYATDKDDSAVLAIDVAAARSGVRPALFSHRMPIDLNPVGLALSADATKLFVVVDSRSPANNVAAPCLTGYTPGAGVHQPDGVLAVLDLAHADRDGVAPQIARIDAGCTPNDIATSSDGSIVWVSDHGDQDIVAYDAAAMTGDGAHALIAKTEMAFGPDAIATIGGGAYVIAAGYEHAADLQHDVEVVTRETSIGKSTLKARIEVGRFPRGVLPFVDGSGVMVATYGSSSVSFFPIGYLRNVLEPPVDTHRKRLPAHPKPRHR